MTTTQIQPTYDLPKVLAYARVSTRSQNIDSQKTIINDYCHSKRMTIDIWDDNIISSSKSEEARGINDLIENLNPGDILLVSEISRLARSNNQVFNIVQKILAKGVSLHLCKQNFVIEGKNKNDMITKILLTIFGLMAELEKDIIQERTKGGVARARAEGKQIGKLPGTKQKTMYDDKKDEIVYYLSRKKISLEAIISLIGLGKRKSLHSFVKTRNLKTDALKISESTTLQQYLEEMKNKRSR